MKGKFLKPVFRQEDDRATLYIEVSLEDAARAMLNYKGKEIEINEVQSPIEAKAEHINALHDFMDKIFDAVDTLKKDNRIPQSLKSDTPDTFDMEERNPHGESDTLDAPLSIEDYEDYKE